MKRRLLEATEADLFKNGKATQADGKIVKKLEIHELVIPEGVTSIDSWAFWGCTKLKSIVIPDSMKIIDHHAFSNCKALRSLVIPNKVTTIGYRAFANCYSMKSITIGTGVKNISHAAFANCTGLTQITIPGNVKFFYPGYDESEGHEVYGGVFSGCTQLRTVTIQKGVPLIPLRMFYDCPSLTHVTIPDSVTRIGENAFEESPNLEELIFQGKSMEEIQSMDNYPWGIENPEQVIVPGIESPSSSTIGESMMKKWRKVYLKSI